MNISLFQMKRSFLWASLLVAPALLGLAPAKAQTSSNPSLSIGDAAITENENYTSLYLPVSLSKASTSTVSVKWATHDYTAVAGSDYDQAAGTVVFKPGQTKAQVRIIVRGDRIEERDEAFRVVLSAPQNASLTKSTGVVAIGDNDYSGSISVADVTDKEGNTGVRPFDFKVTLSTLPLHALALNYATTSDSAKNASDYTRTVGALVIRSGQQNAYVKVPVLCDTAFEPDEKFTFKISGAGLTFAKNTAIATILNDDTPAPPATGIIAFSTFDRALASTQIYIVNADGTNKTRLTDQGGHRPSFSPDGKQIAFVGGKGSAYGIYIMHSDGTDQKLISVGDCDRLSWSPDGKKIAFASFRDSKYQYNNDIYVMNADGTEQTRLTTDRSNEISPAWSPDSSRIIFTCNKSGTSLIYSIGLEGKSVQTITDAQDMSIEYPSYRPDAKTLIAQSYGYDNDHYHYGSAALFVMDLEGKNRRQLTYDDGFEPTWSPDGTKIAACFYGAKGYTRGICVINADGSEVKVVATNGNDLCHYPTWAPGYVPAPRSSTVRSNPAAHSQSPSAPGA